ncbi:Hsp20/alpha crystallin family protein [Paenibacillus dendritiformis]|uniref:Hsp20/alpha crystallin family protein n=1 Tax=Paenibacillus dendritiformis TaxID=130049 RepID=UPI00143D3AD3|nr:Hsp20/alpha crystallin family protein [Paenibacillus dendritiformis]NKI19740.1 Hsp20/alpha crystallin family protein [Paenibacillus dendritiformis]NRG00549.1 Hsp20/alpha crystallin family protein [Paenibacillus dendritiformis]
MPLVPYEPFRHLETMRRELDRFFDHDFAPFKAGASFLGHLNVDVYETEQEVVATCDIPGLEKKEDVHIDVDQNMLTISGSIQRVNEVKEERMHRQERFSGRFHRSIALPAQVSPDNVTATYKNGVLEVRMQKMRGDNKKRIDVQFH